MLRKHFLSFGDSNHQLPKYNKFNLEEKSSYIDNLISNKNDLIKKYETVEVIAKNKGVRNRISSDIQQLSWRIEYLNKNAYI